MADVDHPETGIHPLQRRVTGLVTVPTEEPHSQLKNQYATMGEPAVIVRPVSAHDVAETISYAAAASLPIAVRSGGHSGPTFGSYDRALVIDLRDLNRIVVHNNDLATVGAGATWGEVADTLGDHNLAITSGDTRSVGVGGLTLGGGIGWLVRTYGLALDNLVEVEIVTATGQIMRANSSHHSDLFWAVRGGGGNFGVITEFTFRARRLTGVVAGTIDLSAATSINTTLRQWRDVMRSAPEELNTTLVSMTAFGDQGGMTQLLVCYGGDDEAAANAAIDPLNSISGAGARTVGPKPYAELLEDPHPPQTPVKMVATNSFADDFSDEAIDALSAVHSHIGGVVMVRYLRGAFNRVPAESTAFAHRDAEALLIGAAVLPIDAPIEASDRVVELWSSLDPYTRGTYGNFAFAANSGTTDRIYSPATLHRLREIKRQYDPGNLFRRNHNIVPL